MSDHGSPRIKSETTVNGQAREVPDLATIRITSEGWLQILSTFIVFFNTW